MIFHRVFIREVLQTSGAVSAILLAIFLVTRVVGFLRQAAEGTIAVDSVFMLLLLKIISTLDVLIPIVIFISMLLVLGRWVRDNEMTVITACGVSMQYFLPAIAILAVIISSLVALLTLYLAPLAEQVTRSITEEFRTRSETSVITPGVFTETRNGLGVYFVEQYNEASDTYSNLFIYNGGTEEDSIMIAATGFKKVDAVTHDEFLVAKNGTQYHGNAGDPEYTIVNFETYGHRLQKHSNENRTLPVKATPTTKLMTMDHRTAVGELHWRLSSIVMIPVLLLLALCFSSITTRSHRFPGMIHAILIYFAYSNLLGLTLALMRRGSIPAHLSLWVVHLCFLALALYLFPRRIRNLRLFPGLPG